MKKLSNIILVLTVILFVIGCSTNKTESEEKEKTVKTTSIPAQYFDKKTTQSTISKSQMKKDIQLYLDSDKKLTKAGNYYEVLSNPEKELTQKDIDKIKKASHLKKENDQNFSNYIQNNELPNGYQTNVERISKFTQSNNQVMMNLDKSIENSSDKIKNGKLPKKELKALRQSAKSVNGKEQAKIEQFLKQENIHTIAFEK